MNKTTNLDDVHKQAWLFDFRAVKASYTWHEAVEFINRDPSAEKCWASNTDPLAYCCLVYSAPWGNIWTLAFFQSLNALFVRDVVIPTFNENDYILIPFWGPVYGAEEKALIKNAKFPENIFFLGNSTDCTEILRSQGLQAFTVSHNAFIDPNLFKPMDLQRTFDAIYLGSCRPQKRLELSKELSDLLVVMDSGPETRQVVAHAKTIIEYPHPFYIPIYVNLARCGILLSANEGGCYASTEYLYCGIPVVSTKSIGGRDAYYDDVTAIIINDAPESVRQGVEWLCQRKTDPWEIRRRALTVSDQMLNSLANEILLPIFVRHRDAHAFNPRGFVNAEMNKSKALTSKGRTFFQPESPTHPRIENIKKEQKITFA
jgi:hypothetical protein